MFGHIQYFFCLYYNELQLGLTAVGVVAATKSVHLVTAVMATEVICDCLHSL